MPPDICSEPLNALRRPTKRRSLEPLPANLDLYSSRECPRNRVGDDYQGKAERKHDWGHKPTFHFICHL